MNRKENLCWILFTEFFKVGLFTIGGGLAMIPLITKIMVEDRKWISEDEMMECVAISQTVPGIIAINAATYVGYKKAGMKGGIAATIGVILPSFMIILLLANVLEIVAKKDFVQGAFVGIKACVTGLVLCVAYNLGKQNLTSVAHWVLAVSAFLMVVLFGINAIITIVVLAALGAMYFMRKVEKNE